MTQSYQSRNRAAFIFIFITVALDMLALGIMVPVLPKLVVEFEGGDIARGAWITGIFGFAWAAMQFFFSPILGAMSDRYGRRPVVLLSNLGLGLDYLFMGVAPTVAWLFVGRLISGVTAASFPTASAYIADVTPPEKRAARFGMLGAAFGLGFVVGPAIGGMLGQISLRLPFWAAAALSLANAAYGFFILPESLPPEKRARVPLLKSNPLAALKMLQGHPELFGLSAATFLYYLAHESLPSVFVLYTDYRYHWGAKDVGLALAAVGISSTLVSALLVGKAVAKLGERGAVFTGLLFGILGFGLYGLAPSGELFLAGIPLVALWGITSPSMQAMMTRLAGASEQGRLQGAMSSMRGISGMIGPLLFTQLLSGAIHASDFVQLPGAPFVVASLLLMMSCGVVAWVTATRTELAQATNRS